MKKLCIYHSNCNDGFGAAWAAWKALGDSCEYLPAQYGDTPPDVTGREVFILDFSYNKEVLIELCRTAEKIFLLDHHKTAIKDLVFTPEELSQYPEIHKIFLLLDDQYSGAALAWNFFHATTPTPLLISYIEDRDLWKFELHFTKAVHAFLSSLPFDFTQWNDVADTIEIDPTSIYDQGDAILRTTQKHVETMLKNPPSIRLKTDGIDETIEIVNCPGWMASDLGHELGKRNLFGLTYFDLKDKRVFSLRSQEGGIDVSEIAKSFGGGGHKHAAGFTMPLDHQLMFDHITQPPYILHEHLPINAIDLSRLKPGPMNFVSV